MIQLSTFERVASTHLDQKLELRGSGEEQTVAPRSFGRRIVTFFNKTKASDSNKLVKREFVAAIKKQYGEQNGERMASLASKQINVESGKSLTGRVVQQVLTAVKQEMAQSAPDVTKGDSGAQLRDIELSNPPSKQIKVDSENPSSVKAEVKQEVAREVIKAGSVAQLREVERKHDEVLPMVSVFNFVKEAQKDVKGLFYSTGMKSAIETALDTKSTHEQVKQAKDKISESVGDQIASMRKESKTIAIANLPEIDLRDMVKEELQKVTGGTHFTGGYEGPFRCRRKSVVDKIVNTVAESLKKSSSSVANAEEIP